MARRSKGVPQERDYVPYQRPEERVLHRVGEHGEVVAYTEDGYGVRKDDGLGVIKPTNSAGGLLFLAILLAACMAGLIHFVVQVILQNAWDIAARTWWVFPACIFPFVVAWAGYFKERKAERLRRARNLPRPAG